MSMDLIFTGLLHGLILSIIAYGIMIPFRILNFPDLTAEGAYPLGGAIYTSIIIAGFSPIIAMIAAMLGAGLMAIATSQVALRLKVNSLLAGIILSTMAYSVNLRIMGKPNIGLFEHIGFDLNITVLSVIIALCIIPLVLFLRTDFGLRLRTVGFNPGFAEKQGINVHRYTALGLFIAGSLFGLAGSLIVQIQNYMDVGMGVGIVIHALASVMIGEAIVGNSTLNKQLIAPLIGAVIYQQIQGIALSLGLAPSDLRFFTGGIILSIIAIQRGGLR